jgi:GNAT superfamily N-acetyltransferase
MQLDTTYLYQILGEATALFFHGAPQRAVQLTPTGWLVSTGEPLADFNQLLIDQGPDAAAQLRTFHTLLQERQLPALYFFTDRVAAQLAATAQALGIQAVGKAPVMICQAADMHLTPAAYTVKPVATAAALDDMCQVLADAFTFPLDATRRVLGERMLNAHGLTVYLAYRDGQPVSTVTTSQSGPVVGVWAMATAAAQQRQGAGYALLTQVMAQHRERGARAFYLYATEAGKPLYERIGYRTVSELHIGATGHSTQVMGH